MKRMNESAFDIKGQKLIDQAYELRKSAEEKAADEVQEQAGPKPACIESRPSKSRSGKKKMAILGLYDRTESTHA